MAAEFRWTLDNTTSGILVIGEPKGYENIELVLRRDEKYHGVFSEFADREIQFTCEHSGIEGGKEYIDNLYETLGIDTLITLLIEYRCDDCDAFETLFNGKLNLSTYNTGVDGRVGQFTNVRVERNDITRIVRNRADTEINLNDLFSVDGSALTAYTAAPLTQNMHSQQIDLQSELEDTSFPVTYSDLFALTFPAPANVNMFIQHPISMFQNDLKHTSDNPDNTSFASGLAVNASSLLPFHNAQEGKLLVYPETYNFSWNFVGTWNDCADLASTRNVVSVALVLAYGADLDDVQNNNKTILLGTLPVGYPTGAVCPVTLSIPFSFVGSTTRVIGLDDNLWLYWFVNQYTITAGPANLNVLLSVDYTRNELIHSVNSIRINDTREVFMFYEAFARTCESITDQTTYAFKSDYLGRDSALPTPSQPNAGNAPVYAADGCGALNCMASGLALREYAYLDKFAIKPDFTTLNQLFDTVNALYNVGLGVEQHSGQDVVRVEDKAYFYDNTLIIQLINVPEISYRVESDMFYNKFTVGYETWKPFNFDGLDSINGRLEWDLPVAIVKNELNVLCPMSSDGFTIEILKRQVENNFNDDRYDYQNFVIHLIRLGAPFTGILFTATDTEFTATAGFNNPVSRYNIDITPKKNLLNWLNVLGASIEKNAGELVRFRGGEANYDITTTRTANSCPGDFSAALLDEDADVAWDNANARLNEPLWIPEVYEFDFPLTYTQYKTIRDDPRGFIEFSEGDPNTDTSLTFIRGFILEISYKLRGGLTHFTLLRKYET